MEQLCQKAYQKRVLRGDFPPRAIYDPLSEFARLLKPASYPIHPSKKLSHMPKLGGICQMARTYLADLSLLVVKIPSSSNWYLIATWEIPGGA